MRHDVSEQVARLLSGINTGPAVGDGSGLTLVPLAGPHALLAPSLASQLEVDETTPPNPSILRVTNRGPGDVALHTGDLFAGGLADRAVIGPGVVGPNGDRLVPVEPVEGRWWWSDPLALTGMLDPSPSALIAIISLGVGAGRGVAATARTGLWSLGRNSSEPRDVAWAQPETGAARGWLLLAGTRVLAVRIWDRRRPLVAPGHPPAAPHRDVDLAARRFLRRLDAVHWTEGVSPGTADAEIGGLQARVLHHGGAVVELSAVRVSDELASALRRDPVP